MVNNNMKTEELIKWQYEFYETLFANCPQKLCTVNDVCFYLTRANSVFYSFGKATGLVFADSFFNGPNNHEPACRLSPQYSNECQYCLLCKPNFDSIAAAVKESWSKFIS